MAVSFYRGPDARRRWIMRWHHWFRNALTQPRTGRISRPRPPGRRRLRPRLEQFEDRTLLASYPAGSVSDLIKDINAANAAGGMNTITLTAPTSSPYVLTAVDNTTDGANGLPVIANKDTLRIIGNGNTIERTTASGTPAFRLFDVASGAALTLENLTLQNGLAFGSGSASEGGAIYSQGTLILSAVTAQDNMAQGSDATVVNKKTTPGNDAKGGGIWSNGSLTAENGARIQNNQAIGGYGVIQLSCQGCGVDVAGGSGWGGGLYVAGGSVSLTAITVSNNSALGGKGGPNGNAYGGGLYMDPATVTLSSDTVNDNQATGYVSPSGPGRTSSSYGGAMYVNGGTVNLSGDVVDGNFAGGWPGLQWSYDDSQDSYGGGLYVAAGTVTLSNDTVENNVAIGASYAIGAGLDIASHAKVSIDAFTVSNTISNTSYYPSIFSRIDNIDGPYTQT
jgi:hypothetical protein